MHWLRSQPVVMQASWRDFLHGMYHGGSAVGIFFKQVSRKLLDIMMGFAAGVMIAASFWSLLHRQLSMRRFLWQSCLGCLQRLAFSGRFFPAADRCGSASLALEQGYFGGRKCS